MKDSKETYFGALIESIERRKKIKHFIWGIVVGFIIVMCGIMMSGCFYDQFLDVGCMDDYKFNDSKIEVSSVEEVQEYVYNTITFKFDNDVWGDDYWQLPEDTYSMKTGDCEDFCLLFMYLCKIRLNIETEMIRVSEKHTNANHMIVKLVEKNIYIDPQLSYLDDFDIFEYEYKLKIKYCEAIWMAYYYHDSVGEYH